MGNPFSVYLWSVFETNALTLMPWEMSAWRSADQNFRFQKHNKVYFCSGFAPSKPPCLDTWSLGANLIQQLPIQEWIHIVQFRCISVSLGADLIWAQIPDEDRVAPQWIVAPFATIFLHLILIIFWSVFGRQSHALAKYWKLGNKSPDELDDPFSLPKKFFCVCLIDRYPSFSKRKINIEIAFLIR